MPDERRSTKRRGTDRKGSTKKARPTTPSPTKRGKSPNERTSVTRCRTIRIGFPTAARPNTTPSPAKSDDRFFKADDWSIMNAAHDKVSTLVFQDGPYRRKLLELASWSIENVNKLLTQPTQFNADQVVRSAWESVVYYWAEHSDVRIQLGEATAFASMGQQGQLFFPVIAISDCFQENDYPATTSEQSNRDSTMDKKTSLLFFRKLKHEFLHVVHRYLAIHHLKNFTAEALTPQALTPQKYMPLHQADRSNPVPELGDHDEEEDSGGPILPRYNNQKLSDNNPLCLQVNGKFLALNDTQVDGLLDVDVYFMKVLERPHNPGSWLFGQSRAVIRGILSTEFFDGSPVASNTQVRRASSGGEAESRSSSPAIPRTKTNPGNRNLALWRVLGNDPIVCPPSSRNIVSRSSSPLNKLKAF